MQAVTSCRICTNAENNQPLRVREMQFGMGDEFDYFQCGKCRCFQIQKVPQDLGKYYPKNYFAFTPDLDNPRSPKLKLLFRGVKALAPVFRFLLMNKSSAGTAARRVLGNFRSGLLLLEVMSRAKITLDSPILDVGCGSGTLLYLLRQMGFRDLTGIDPFIERDVQYQNQVKVYKADLAQFLKTTDRQFDLITFHHSFEHMENQREVLHMAAELISEKGQILLRMPVIDCYAFDHYRENHVSLDAPRHLVIHSRQSLEVLAAQVGLKIDEVVYDSSECQFWASEQYQKGIPLESKASYRYDKKNSLFSAGDIRRFRKMTRRLNAQGQGDWGSFYLSKKEEPSSQLLH